MSLSISRTPPWAVLSLSGTADVTQGGTGAASFTAGASLWGNGTSAIQADSGFTRTGASGRYLFGATDNGLDKVQINGGIAIPNLTVRSAFGEVKFVTSGTFFDLGTSLSFIGADGIEDGNGASVIFTSGAGAGFGNGGDIDVSASDGGENGGGGNFQAVCGNGGSTSGDGGSGFFNAGNPLTLGNGGSFEFVAGNGAGTGGSGGNIIFRLGEESSGGVKGLLNLGSAGANPYAVANGTGTVTISNVAPSGVGTATISAWLPVRVDSVVYFIPMWT
jgi:hypothetical protein